MGQIWKVVQPFALYPCALSSLNWSCSFFQLPPTTAFFLLLTPFNCCMLLTFWYLILLDILGRSDSALTGNQIFTYDDFNILTKWNTHETQVFHSITSTLSMLTKQKQCWVVLQKGREWSIALMLLKCNIMSSGRATQGTNKGSRWKITLPEHKPLNSWTMTERMFIILFFNCPIARSVTCLIT